VRKSPRSLKHWRAANAEAAVPPPSRQRIIRFDKRQWSVIDGYGDVLRSNFLTSAQAWQ